MVTPMTAKSVKYYFRHVRDFHLLGYYVKGIICSSCFFVILPVTPHGFSDWHVEVPASPRNQKIGSPGGLPQFSDLPGALRPG